MNKDKIICLKKITGYLFWNKNNIVYELANINIINKCRGFNILYSVGLLFIFYSGPLEGMGRKPVKNS